MQIGMNPNPLLRLGCMDA